MKKIKIQKHHVINTILVIILFAGIGYTVYHFFPQIKEFFTPKVTKAQQIVVHQIPQSVEKSFSPEKALEKVQLAQPIIDSILKTIKEIVGLIGAMVTTYFLIKNNTKDKRTARKTSK